MRPCEGKLDYDNLIEKLSESIVTGQTRSVSTVLKGLNCKSIPYHYRARIASLCRRAGQYEIGLRVLAPLVSTEGGNDSNLKVSHQAEYAAFLQKLGSVDEALARLQELDSSSYPKVLLYTAFCFFNQWRYAEAEEVMQAYCTSGDITDYERAIGQINLTACLVILKRHDEALKLIAELSKTLQERKYSRLLANLAELEAQVWVGSRDYERAKKKLDESTAFFSNDNTLDALFFHKWQAYLSDVKKGNPDSLLQVRESALERGHWETVRHVDVLCCQIQFNVSVFNRSVFGTPYEGFRRWVSETLGQPYDLPERIVLGDPQLNRWDPLLAEYGGKVILNQGKHIHQLIHILFTDLYKPHSVGGIFSRLFSDEHFNIETSPNKVHKLVSRAKTWLKKSELPLDIVLTGNDYKLSGLEKISFFAYREIQVPTTYSVNFEVIKRLFSGTGEFTREEVMHKAQWSQSFTVRILAWAQEKNLVKKLSSGPATSYRLAA